MKILGVIQEKCHLGSRCYTTSSLIMNTQTLIVERLIFKQVFAGFRYKGVAIVNWALRGINPDCLLRDSSRVTEGGLYLASKALDHLLNSHNNAVCKVHQNCQSTTKHQYGEHDNKKRTKRYCECSSKYHNRAHREQQERA